MRIDKKKSDSTGQIHYMSGSNGMLPAMFDIQPVSKRIKYIRANYRLNFVKKFWNM